MAVMTQETLVNLEAFCRFFNIDIEPRNTGNRRIFSHVCNNHRAAFEETFKALAVEVMTDPRNGLGLRIKEEVVESRQEKNLRRAR